MELDPPSATLLVVEDEEGLRVPLVRALRRHGYTVLEAEHGIEALERAEAHEERIDLLLTDVMMPQMNGRELARQLRERQPGIKVLFMTGYSDQAIDALALDPERTSFIEKPFPMSRLVDVLRELVERVTGS
jgi:two-component system, cell cycle sensor histidine kinase and response regulator CckA